MNTFFLFPYSSVKKGSKVILYGAGEVGRSFCEQLLFDQYCEVVAIATRNSFRYTSIYGVPAIEPTDIDKYQYDALIVAVAPQNAQSVFDDIEKLGFIPKEKIVSTAYLAKQLQSNMPETSVIQGVFRALNIDKPSYIDVGACHPHMASNTMPFYESGSRGINVEPDIDLKIEFDLYRPEDINLFVGVAPVPGEMKFFKSNDPYLSTFKEANKEFSKQHFHAEYDAPPRTVRVMTLNEIIDKYNNGLFPDFIDIDIEGMDAEVLRSCDFSKSSPKLICAEGSIDEFNQILLHKNCEGGGYRPYCTIPANVIYIRKDLYNTVLRL